jgi:hypothetical protein
MDTKLVWSDANMQGMAPHHTYNPVYEKVTDYQTEFMLNHSAITRRFDSYLPDLQASRNLSIPFLITEDAAVVGSAPIEFAGGFGYTLWAVDFNLAAMARRVSRVANLAGSPTSKRVFWNPDNTGGTKSPGPQVRAPFPAAIFVADFIGMDSKSAVTEVDLGRPFLSAYAMYDNASGKLQRIALINMRVYNATKGNVRNSVTFNLSLGKSVKSVSVRSLHADLGIAAMGYDFAGPTGNVSWAGEQWSHSINLGRGHFTNGAMEETNETVTGGTLSLAVPDSEAVMLIVS